MKRYSDVFITGTDTGIGKTLVTAALARYFSQRGERVGVMKPIETGIDPSLVDAMTDFRLLKQSANSSHSIEQICPVQYRQPLAPSVAAHLNQQPFELGTLDEAFSSIRSTSQKTLVEGCGGLLVPLQPRFRILDLIRRWKLPVLIVGRAGLGTINHTGMTIELCRQNGLEVIGVVLNQTEPKPGEADPHNPETIEREFDVTVFGTIPYLDINDPLERVENLTAHFSYGGVCSSLIQALS